MISAYLLMMDRWMSLDGERTDDDKWTNEYWLWLQTEFEFQLLNFLAMLP